MLIVAPSLLYAQTSTSSATVHADCAAASTANQKKDEDIIRRIEHGWLTGEYCGNPQFLECLLKPDIEHPVGAGRSVRAKEVIDHVVQTTDMTHEVPQLESLAFVHGDAASAHSIMHTTDKAGNPKEVHFVDSYVFHDGR